MNANRGAWHQLAGEAAERGALMRTSSSRLPPWRSASRARRQGFRASAGSPAVGRGKAPHFPLVEESRDVGA
jgi:hypothetical protein